MEQVREIVSRLVLNSLSRGANPWEIRARATQLALHLAEWEISLLGYSAENPDFSELLGSEVVTVFTNKGGYDEEAVV